VAQGRQGNNEDDCEGDEGEAVLDCTPQRLHAVSARFRQGGASAFLP
jgi:hypothetical protein